MNKGQIGKASRYCPHFSECKEPRPQTEGPGALPKARCSGHRAPFKNLRPCFKGRLGRNINTRKSEFDEMSTLNIVHGDGRIVQRC